ncbi:MAG: hypothetical protein FWH17_07735 [Oscillospiraceae bacterium]|nr:hypothetical protein [Oscillospiraceae bacterium]
MSADAIKRILAAEYEGNQVKIIVHDRSKESIAAVHAECEKNAADVLSRAKTEIEQLKHATDRKAMDAAADLASTTENRLAAMSARAEKRLDMVAERIYERIVNIE